MKSIHSFYSLFSGCGGADSGAKTAGLIPIGGIEIDPKIAAIHAHNFGRGVITSPIQDVDIAAIPDMDFLWASPPCPSFSVAKQDRQETPEDLLLAQRTADILKAKRPRWFALENVRGYADSQSLKRITRQLEAMGYAYNVLIVDAADFGVPQNRVRLILMATLDGCMSPLGATHSRLQGLWWPKWVGWYEAIADLLPSCKETCLTERQVQAYHRFAGQSALIDGKANKYGSSTTVASASTPSFAITASADRQVQRAVLMEGNKPSASREIVIKKGSSPSMTVIASLQGQSHCPKAVLVEARSTDYTPSKVRTLDYRCLARLQTFPDWFDWCGPVRKRLRSIGNAVPPLLAQRVVVSLVSGGCR